MSYSLSIKFGADISAIKTALTSLSARFNDFSARARTDVERVSKAIANINLAADGIKKVFAVASQMLSEPLRQFSRKWL